MENLRSAAHEAKLRIDSAREADSARQLAVQQRMLEEQQRRDEELRRNIHETEERAAEFITIMREHDAPLIGYYAGSWEGVWAPQSSPTLYKRLESYQARPNDGEIQRWNEEKYIPKVNSRITPIMGWLAMRPYRMEVVDEQQLEPGCLSTHRVKLPGVFIDQDGQPYPCSDEIRVRGMISVMNEGEFGKPDNTLLGGERAFTRIAARLAMNGYV